MATTEVPETVVCPNCTHNVVIKLYQVDISINSSQGHFHTVHNAREPAYTVYCTNCGHFITNNPTSKPPRRLKSETQSSAKAKPHKATPSKSAAEKASGRVGSKKKRAK